MSSARLLQESVYDGTVDYRRGSPHLSHWPLYDRLTSVLRSELRLLDDRGLPSDVLEIGAGHGGYTEPVLAAGFRVTAVEISRHSGAELERRYGANHNFRLVLDDDGSLAGVGGEFSLVLCVSVLHHIPDYLRFLDELSSRVRPGGTLLALQDPLWYPRARRSARMLDRAAFYAWRMGQGDLRRGFATLGRRVRGTYDEQNPSDMVEYHVIRDGVDEESGAALLRDRFRTVDVMPYWSNQSGLGQRLGERLGLLNTFGLLARDRGTAR